MDIHRVVSGWTDRQGGRFQGRIQGRIQGGNIDM
jgi:hypothetical protein